MTAPSIFASCRSAVDLMRLAGVEPPSPAIEVILLAMAGEPLSRAQRAIWSSISPMPYVPNRKARRIAACIGRRGLKTSGILAWSCVFEALCGGHEAHVAPGSRVYFLIVAPLIAQAREATRAIRGALDALATIGIRYSLRDASGAPEIVIESPRAVAERVITVMSADAVGVRGYAIAFAAFDEAGFLPSEEHLQQRDVDIIRAITPGMAQFPGARMLLTSSPGAPQGVFHNLVTSPRPDDLVFRAPSWINPRITEARCREIAGDDTTFEIEFAARRFGYSGEGWIDSAKALACVGSPHAGRGPRPGHFVIGLDIGQLHDDTAIVVVSTFEIDVSPGHAPVRHVVIEHAEIIASSLFRPTTIEAIASRVAELSRQYGNAPIVFDPFQGPTVKDALRRVGLSEHDGDDAPPRRRFVQASMAPQAQTPRWKLLRDLVHGERLHIPRTSAGETLARQLGQLRASQQSSGALKVEGRRDDVADACALAVSIAMQLPPSAGPQGHVEHRLNGVRWDEEGISVRERFVHVLPNGRERPAETPEWHPSFEDYAREMIKTGKWTAEIERWIARRYGPEHVRPDVDLDALDAERDGAINIPMMTY